MNATAASLGMHQTHFADASGFSPQDLSTPADMLKVAALAMAIPTFAQIVTLQSITLPVSGTVSTYTPLLYLPGVVGVKSGFIQAAGGCDLLAYATQVGGQRVVALAAVTGLEGPNVLNLAGFVALVLAQQAASTVTVVPGVASGRQVAVVTANGKTVRVVTTGSVALLAWPGHVVEQRIEISKLPHAGSGAGTVIGTVAVTSGPQTVRVPVRLAGKLPARTVMQRLL
jgi:D-alanyl-D-alanine carboxypeptidase (penicillin-binding protein 5/6)